MLQSQNGLIFSIKMEVDMKKILNVTALISQDSELTNTSSTWVRVLDMEGSVIAMVQSPQASGDPRDVNKTNKPEILNNVHLKQKKEENINAPLVNATQKMISGPVFDPAMWNGYPNGIWEADYSNEFLNETGNLKHQWATTSSSGQSKKDGTKRDPEASKWKDGAIYDCKCLGVINCDCQPACHIAYCPKTRSESLQLQLQQSLEAFKEFSEEHPDFIVYESIFPETVICFQTAFMAYLLVTDKIFTNAENGIVSDAAHEMSCWVPALFSYSDEATSRHYAKHFIALFDSMFTEAKRRGIDLTDSDFANVVDFSEAERNGFIEAFIQVHSVRNDPRTMAELQEAAAALLCCREHFHAHLTKIKQMHSVVPPGLTDAFESRVLHLLEIENKMDFEYYMNLILQDFPLAKP
ncbi:hypothetical protein BDQ17DRAFT_1437166 [Cyathus striatus]|nr:hypothetical protein BDQ17DRAFT_1437166 [Cyathus striatus]